MQSVTMSGVSVKYTDQDKQSNIDRHIDAVDTGKAIKKLTKEEPTRHILRFDTLMLWT